MTHASYTYRPMSEAPKDGTPIIAVLEGVECAIAWNAFMLTDERELGWAYFEEDDDGVTFQRIGCEPSGWRKMLP